MTQNIEIKKVFSFLSFKKYKLILCSQRLCDLLGWSLSDDSKNDNKNNGYHILHEEAFTFTWKNKGNNIEKEITKTSDKKLIKSIISI